VTIDLESREGQTFYRLASELHERRTGRRGNLRWDRKRRDTKRIRPPLELLHDYWRGDPPLNDVHAGLKPYVRQFIRMGRLNIGGLLVSSTQNRMALRGFHTAHRNDEAGDQVSQAIMRATNYTLVSRDIHDMMLAMGDAYAIVTPPATEGGFPSVTAEDPRQVITAHDPMSGQPFAALKMFRDDWAEEDVAYLFLKDEETGVTYVHSARRKGFTSMTDKAFRFDADSWTWGPEEEIQETPHGRFPVVRFRNRHGVGEFEEHLDALDRINDKIFNEWWTSKIQAFRQRAVKGLPDTQKVQQADGTLKEEEIDYEDMFTASPDEMWRVPEGVDFWESSALDMGPIIQAVQKDLERLAAAASQPLHTITPDAANGSAEGASLMREEHVYKVEDRRDRTTPAHAETMALLMSFYGHDHDDHDNRLTIEPIWGPLERHSLQEWSNAASMVRDVYPQEYIWTEIAQHTPAEIPSLRQAMARGRLFGATPGASAPAGAPGTGLFAPPAPGAPSSQLPPVQVPSSADGN
jgi:hypothetical protein